MMLVRLSQTNRQWINLIHSLACLLSLNHDTRETHSTGRELPTVKTLVRPQTHKREMSSICKEQIKQLFFKKGSTCNISILSKGNGINRTVCNSTLGFIRDTVTCNHRMCAHLYWWHVFWTSDLGRPSWRNNVFCPTTSASLRIVVLSDVARGQTSFRLIWHFQTFKPWRNDVGLVWERSKRQTCSVHPLEWNGLWWFSAGTTYLHRICTAQKVSWLWWSTLKVCVCVCFCWCFLMSELSSSHCSGLSNTESGSTEIFSFFSGQLYSLGSFVCTKTNHIQVPRGEQVDKSNQEWTHKVFFPLTSSRVFSSCISPSICSTNSSVKSIYSGRTVSQTSRGNTDMVCLCVCVCPPEARGHGLHTDALQWRTRLRLL